MAWIRRSPFTDSEDPVARMVALIAERAVLEGAPLTEEEQRLLTAEKVGPNIVPGPVSEELQAKVKKLVELMLDSEIGSSDPKNLGGSLEWASDSSYSNVVTIVEDVFRSRAQNLPKLRDRRWMADRVQLVGCGIVAVILLMLFVASIDYFFSGK